MEALEGMASGTEEIPPEAQPHKCSLAKAKLTTKAGNPQPRLLRLRGKQPVFKAKPFSQASLGSKTKIKKKRRQKRKKQRKKEEERQKEEKNVTAEERSFLKNTRSKKKDLTEVRRKVIAGVIPKARTGYAIFVQEMRALKREPVRNIAKKWKSLNAEERGKYRKRSKQEFEAQHEQALALGLKLRTSQVQITAQAPLPESPIAEPLPVCHLGPYHFNHEAAPLIHCSSWSIIQATDSRQGCEVALKVFHGPVGADSAKKEIEVYKRLSQNQQNLSPDSSTHSGFLRPLGMESTSVSLSWLALPLIRQGTLSMRIKEESKLHGWDLYSVSVQLARGIRHLHALGILHLDIKPSNLLWDYSNRLLYIADFGKAKDISPASEDYEAVTEPYRPMELFQGLSYHPPQLTPAVDYWSYGCTLFEAATGSLKFPIPVIKSLQLWQSRVNTCASHGISVECALSMESSLNVGIYQGVITKCLALNPSARSLPEAGWFDKVRPSFGDGIKCTV